MKEPAKPLDEPSVVCAGIVVADHLTTPISHVPAAGELVKADDLVLNIGGCASNAAVALSKLGIRSSVCGRVGDDVFGRYVADVLSAHQVDCRALTIDRERSTSQSLIINVSGQDRRFIHSFGANAGLSADDVAGALRDSTKVLYVGGYLILPGVDPKALADVFRQARGRGILTVLDVVTPASGRYLDALRPVLAETDAFLPNTDEAALILGESDPIRQAEIFREMGAKLVAITMGSQGAIALSDSLRLRLGTYPVKYVDASGGGDAFDAGYIAGLLDGRDLVDCLKLASALGASCVRAVGTTAGIFTRAEADAFLASRELKIEPL